MAVRDLIPIKRRGSDVAHRREDDPFVALRRRMNRMFDDFFDGFDMDWPLGWPETSLASGTYSPRVDVSETDDEIRVSAELPGMDEKDVNVELDEKTLTIRGERKDEREEKDANWYRREQSYGSFHRTVALPAGVEGDKAKAKFKNGVLSVVLPKREEEKRKHKTIEIETE